MKGLLRINSDEYVIDNLAFYRITQGVDKPFDFVIEVETVPAEPSVKIETAETIDESGGLDPEHPLNREASKVAKVQKVAEGVSRPSVRGIGTAFEHEVLPLSQAMHPALLESLRVEKFVRIVEKCPDEIAPTARQVIRTKYYVVAGGSLENGLRELVAEERRIAGKRSLFVAQPTEIVFNKEKTKFKLQETVFVLDEEKPATADLKIELDTQVANG